MIIKLYLMLGTGIEAYSLSTVIKAHASREIYQPCREEFVVGLSRYSGFTGDSAPST